MSENVAALEGLEGVDEITKGEKETTILKKATNATSANISESSSSNGEEYEIVQMMQQGESKSENNVPMPDTSVSQNPVSPSLNIVGNGNQIELQKTLEECVQDDLKLSDNNVPISSENSVGANSNNVSVVNETIMGDGTESDNHTVFDNIKYLGAAVINDPKNERLIHSLMKELNVIDDLCDDDQEDESDIVPPQSSDTSAGHDVTIRVPKSADGSVFVRCCNKNDSLSNDEGGIVGDFPIYRIIFFARGNAGTTEEACFAFTVAIPVTPSLKSTGDAVKPSQGKVTFKCHAFRCSKSEIVTKVFAGFAYAFKKPRNEGIVD